jgi:hypothetical protein
MIWNKEQLENLTEDPLQTDVLLPLFREMGYQDVHLRHGGILEQGKDIVMWQDEGLKGRVNYAVVAKAVRIAGSVSSVGEVLTQIRQAFAAPYIDRSTHEERRVHYCFVVTSRDIISEGTFSLKCLLERENLDRYVRMIDGTKLWDLLCRHAPQQIAIAMIREGYNALAEGSLLTNLSIQVSGSGMHLRAEQLALGSNGILLEPDFPDTEDGDKQRAGFEELMRTGGPVPADSSLADLLGLPEFLRDIISRGSQAELRLSPSQSPVEQPMLMSVLLHADDGDEYLLPYVSFDRVTGGTDVFRATNEGQSLPFKLELVASRQSRTLRVNYRFSSHGSNVHWLSEEIACRRVVAKGCMISLTDLRTGRVIPVGASGAGQAEQYSDSFCELARMALSVQEATGGLLNLPRRDVFTPEDAQTLTQLDHIIRKGEPIRPMDHLTITRTPGQESADAFLAGMPEAGAQLHVRQAETSIELWGTQVPLGPIEIHCERAIIHPDDRQALAASNSGECLQLRILPVAGQQFNVKYPKWGSTEHEGEWQPNN